MGVKSRAILNSNTDSELRQNCESNYEGQYFDIDMLKLGNHVGAKRVVKKNQSQDKHKMTGMYPALNLALVEYSSKQKPISLIYGKLYKQALHIPMPELCYQQSRVEASIVMVTSGACNMDKRWI
ncbi:hypothetical protein RRG08_028094 [Elysia crispata]|uniref:Uncharacterized protein n=1 Tax=Elysia crispata TaxID=231223 RepID=A0AAE1E6R1_9GAST|nr:hypothetical protein RRG08_028094 [Elysia crispata]